MNECRRCGNTAEDNVIGFLDRYGLCYECSELFKPKIIQILNDERLELTKEQKKAINRLGAAFKACEVAGVLFHNCYGTLIAYDSKFIECVNDDKDEYDCHDGTEVKNVYDMEMWADDRHYIHFKE